MRMHLLAPVAGVLLLMTPAQAQDKIQTAFMQEILIKTALLTLNDANVTGNYTVLHAKLSKPFREQFKPEQLKQGFKTFADQKIDYGVIATKTPIPTGEAMIDTRGALLLCGYFDITPSRVNYA